MSGRTDSITVGLPTGEEKCMKQPRKHLTNNPAIHTQSPTMASWGLPITKRTPSNSTPSPPKQPESGQKFSHPHRPHYESRRCLHHREALRNVGHTSPMRGIRNFVQPLDAKNEFDAVVITRRFCNAIRAKCFRGDVRASRDSHSNLYTSRRRSRR
jgi:hypothetical protein